MTDCIDWQGYVQPKGYGMCGQTDSTGSRLAHRVAYEEAHGPITPGLVIDHLCRNRRCVNPDHMEAVTNAENVRRGVAKRDPELIAAIHALLGEGQSGRKVARALGVSHTHVQRVLKGLVTAP